MCADVWWNAVGGSQNYALLPPPNLDADPRHNRRANVLFLDGHVIPILFADFPLDTTAFTILPCRGMFPCRTDVVTPRFGTCTSQ